MQRVVGAHEGAHEVGGACVQEGGGVETVSAVEGVGAAAPDQGIVAVAAAQNVVASVAAGSAIVPDLIHFNIPGAGVHTITPVTLLPSLSDSVIIDGANGGVATNRVELSGAGALSTGLNFPSGPSNSEIRNLVINGFTSRQILFIAVTNSTIQGNFLGLNAAGTALVANSGLGIEMCCGSSILIGGTTAAARNVTARSAESSTTPPSISAQVHRASTISGTPSPFFSFWVATALGGKSLPFDQRGVLFPHLAGLHHSVMLDIRLARMPASIVLMIRFGLVERFETGDLRNNRLRKNLRAV
jgi:hypothetical protein